MIALHPFLLVVSLVCFLLAVPPIPTRINLVALGLVFYILSLLLPLR